MRDLRLVARVAREEANRYLRGFNPRVLVFAIVAAVLGGLLLPVVIERGITPDEGLYRAEVNATSPLREVLEAGRQFEVIVGPGRAFLEQRTDLWILGTTVHYADTDRGRAAVRDFADFASRYYDEVLTDEANQTAAFPVLVHVVYEVRTVGPAQLAQAQRGPPLPTGAFTNANESLILARSDAAPATQIPGEIDPPFPIRSLLLTFAYLVPLNFVGQYFAGSLLAERTRRRGVLLLSAPLTGPQILLAKTSPYALLLLAYAVVATFLLGAGLEALVASLPILLFFLAATALAALVARSHRELTFLITTMSVALSTYLFLPAIFTQVGAIAYISPVSVVAASIRGDAVPLPAVLYSILPLGLAGLVLCRLAASVYREETLFAPQALLPKLVDTVHQNLRKVRHFLYAGALLIPFVFGAELFVLAFAVSLPLRVALPAFLIGVAVVEECAKALPALAHYRRSAAPKPAWKVGTLTGLGFALGEKLALLFALVGLDLFRLGNAFLASVGIAASAALVLAPFLLHIVTANLTAYGARRGRATLTAAVLLAIVVHVVYNLQVIRNVA